MKICDELFECIQNKLDKNVFGSKNIFVNALLEEDVKETFPDSVLFIYQIT